MLFPLATRLTRRFGHPLPKQLIVIFAPLGARTVRREICAPLANTTPLMRTVGNGRIRLAVVWGAAAAGGGACSVGNGGTGTGGGAGVGTGGGTGVAAGGGGLVTAAVAGDIFHVRSRMYRSRYAY